MKRNKQGFTLIELLVVIAIIGILATIALVSLNSARKKARDSKRISEVKQLAQAIETAGIDNPTTILCGAADAITSGAACEPVGDLTDAVWDSIKDPISTNLTVCDETDLDTETTCGYTMEGGSTPSAYQICFSLEEKSAIDSAAAGTVSIVTGSQFKADCD